VLRRLEALDVPLAASHDLMSVLGAVVPTQAVLVTSGEPEAVPGAGVFRVRTAAAS
jgi:hypothetical protein